MGAAGAAVGSGVGGGEGCRVGGSGAGRESQSYCSGQDDGDAVFHVGLLFLIFQLNGKGKRAKPLRPHRLGHLPTAWCGFCAGFARVTAAPHGVGGGVFGDTAALLHFLQAQAVIPPVACCAGVAAVGIGVGRGRDKRLAVFTAEGAAVGTVGGYGPIAKTLKRKTTKIAIDST